MIALIYAISRNNVIGLNNQLPWHYKEDLQYFKKTTINHPILMGHKTYQGLPNKLKYRKNIVLSKNKDLLIEGVSVINNIDSILKDYAKNENNLIFIIGGKQIYELFLNHADCLYISELNEEVHGDTYLHIPTTNYTLIHEEKSLKNPITYKIYKQGV